MVIHMETLATKLPPGLVDGVDALIRRGDYPNRSEVLRAAVRRFLAMEAGAAPPAAGAPCPDRVGGPRRAPRRGAWSRVSVESWATGTAGACYACGETLTPV